MKITVKVVAGSKGGRFTNTKKEIIEIGDGFTREQIEEELVKVNDAANKKLRLMRMHSEMTLLEINGVPI